jgi:hypothetical protein
MQVVILEEMQTWLLRLVQKPELRVDLCYCFKETIASLENPNSRVDLPSTNFSVKIVDGLLSGIKMTALLGTISNLVTLLMAERMIQNMTNDYATRFTDYVVQGDDDDLAVTSWTNAIQTIFAYRLMNFKVNPAKTFVAADRDEFLRRVMHKGRVNGYPGRGISSILWSNPINTAPIDGDARAREVMLGWVTIANRGAENWKELAVLDVARALKTSKKNAFDWMHTPASFGGFGFKPFASRWLKIVNAEKKSPGSLFQTDIQNFLTKTKNWNISETSAKDHVRSTLYFNISDEIIEPNKMSEVDVHLPWIPGRQLSETDLMFEPKWDMEEMPGWARGLWLQTILDDKTLSNVLLEEKISSALHDESLATWMIIKKKRKSVWRAWVERDLPFGLPAVEGWDQASISVFHRPIKHKWFSEALGSKNCNMLTLQRAGVAAELETGRVMSRELHQVSN